MSDKKDLLLRLAVLSEQYPQSVLSSDGDSSFEELSRIYDTYVKIAKETDELKETKNLISIIYLFLETLCFRLGDTEKKGFARKEIENLDHVTSIKDLINLFISVVTSIESPKSTKPDHHKEAYVLRQICKICHDNSSTNSDTRETHTVLEQILLICNGYYNSYSSC
jgi:hypothetical protein